MHSCDETSDRTAGKTAPPVSGALLPGMLRLFPCDALCKPSKETYIHDRKTKKTNGDPAPPLLVFFVFRPTSSGSP